MKLKDWDEKEQRQGNNEGKRPDRKTGADAASDEAWEGAGSFPDEGYEGRESEADLEAEEWEALPADMDEEAPWEGTMPEEEPEDGRWDRRMPEQDLEEDERWEESELDSKPGVSYRWKKFNLDSEPDGGRWKGAAEEPDSDGRTERQKQKGASADRRGKEAARASHRGQKTVEKGKEESWEEELPPMKPWTKALVFIVLAVIAAIICAILWYFAHPEKPDGGDGQDVSSQATESPDESGEQAPKLDLEEPGDDEGQSGGSLSGLAPEGTGPGSGTSDGTGADSGLASGTDAESDNGGTGTETGDGSGTTEPGIGDGGGGTGTEPGAGTGGESASPEPEEREPVSGTEDMTFQAVQESVTPKDVVNLRLVPTAADAANIVTQAHNGETLVRIGINPDTGWSKIDYNGQTLYAVSQYLTADLSYRPAVQPSDPNRVSTVSGRIIIFQNCDDWISPKEYVNLRTEPSTTEGDATVSCQLNYGEKVHRTGYSRDSGWSRVEYNGQVLYVVTSLMYEVAAE